MKSYSYDKLSEMRIQAFLSGLGVTILKLDVREGFECGEPMIQTLEDGR